jgi:hypothetical protein
MPLPNIENNQRLPRIIIAHYDDLGFTPGQNIVVKIIPQNASPVIAFNEIIQKERVDIYLFIPPKWTVEWAAIEKAIKILTENQHINYVYFDYNGQYLPSLLLPGQHSIRQIPLFIKNIPALFNPGLQYLYMHDMFTKLYQTSLGIHVAESLTKTTQELTQQQIQRDLNIIHESGN